MLVHFPAFQLDRMKFDPIARRRGLVGLFLLALLVIGAGIGLRDPWPADEPRFALVAKQMVEQGQWLYPHRGDELYSDKPPLFMWAQAASHAITGSWRVAFLLPSLLASLGTLALLYDITRRLRGHRVAMLATTALLFTLHFTFQAKKAQIDPSVVFWITLSVYGLLRHTLLGPNWRCYALAWFAAGVGTITKGVGVLALLMLLPYAYGRWRGWQGLSAMRGGWRWWIGPPMFLLAVSIWLLPMLIGVLTSDSPELRAYAHDILFRQTAQRYTDSWDHHQPAWYYLGVMLSMWLPLVLVLPWAVPNLARRIRRGDARTLLPMAWAGMIVLFFSLPDGKRDVYILPALPMVCLVLAPLLPAILRRRPVQHAAFGFVLLLGIGLLGFGIAALAGSPGFEQKLIVQRGFAADDPRPWWLLCSLGGVLILAALVAGWRRGVLGLHAGLAGLWVLFGFWGYPLLNDSSSAAAVMRRAGELIGKESELALVAWKEQNLLQADRPARTFGFLVPWDEQLRRAIAWQAEVPERRWIFILADAAEDCVDPGKAIDVGRANRRHWWVFRADAVLPACRAIAAPPSVSVLPARDAAPGAESQGSAEG